MGKVKLSDVPIADSVDPAIASALRQMVGNQKALITAVESDEVTFASVAGQLRTAHRLGRKPTKWGVVDRDGTATIHATSADKALWTDSLVVFTTSGTGTNFTVELR